MGCFLTQLTVCFALQGLFSFIRFNWSIVVLIFCTISVLSIGKEVLTYAYHGFLLFAEMILFSVLFLLL